MQFAFFVTGVLWLTASHLAASHAAQSISDRLNLVTALSLMEESFFLILLLTGFTTLSWVATRVGGVRYTNALPKRPSSAREWRLGAAIGWAALLLTVLPMALTGQLHPQFWFAPRTWFATLISILTLAVETLALEVAFRGYIFRRLIEAVGTATATIFLSVIYAVSFSFHPNSTSFSVFVTLLSGILFSFAYLRTHGLWLGWGLHFAWSAASAVILGLPAAGIVYTSIVDTATGTPLWLTGGAYGPEGALLTVITIPAAMIILYQATRDYAWQYTHAPVIAAGTPVIIAPPKAHIEMEQTAAPKPATLVQILSKTPTAASTMPVIEQHLNASSESKQ